MINVTFFTCSADNRTVDKSGYLNSVISSTAIMYENTSIVSPIIKFAWNTNGAIPNVNYAYIPQFGRYYYVTDVKALIGGSMEYHLRCDVLMTYRGAIRSSTQTVVRSESIGKPTMIPDENYPLMPNKNMKVILFDNPNFNLANATANSYNFILNVSGGGSGQTS